MAARKYGRGSGQAGARRGEKAAGGGHQVAPAAKKTEAELIDLLRRKAQGYLHLPNVTSVGLGYRLKGGKPTAEVVIQFTVGKKLTPEGLAAENLEPLPAMITDDDGTQVPVDVIERSYKPSFEVLSDPVAEARAEAPSPRELRRSRLDPIRPGISVSHPLGSAGTVGAIVYDDETGAPYLLSNWHVLHTPAGALGDAVVQPGPFDDSDVTRNACGRLIRSHLGLAGDCAIASVEGRGLDETILELDVQPRRVGRANLGDRVVKSGRTTGVTRGVVNRVGVVANIDYGGRVGVQQVGGFEIGPDPAAPPADGEISMGGDSGSCWMIDAAEGRDVAVGLHFAGETDPEPSAEHAIACNIHSVLEKLKVSLVNPRGVEVDEHALFEEILARLDLLAERTAELERRGVERGGSCSCQSGTMGVGRGARAAMPSERASAAEAGLPVYGNWCGPGHGGGTPIDEVDAACMRHDECYGRRGYFDCECDDQLDRDLSRALASGRLSFRGRVLGRVIQAYFRVQPCRNRGGREAVLAASVPAMPVRGAILGTTQVAASSKRVWRRERP